jgi:uncharacterized protein YyaL (SSP411 family)
MSESRSHSHTNRLIGETSPYLLQHAHNPVDWHPWGEEALRRAAEEDRPILLSIGYSSCHWCHVMERESFEDESVAAIMNRAFVCVKVDREERPDLDEVYMAATVAMNNGQGGWPMTVFLTPDQKPFFAGTYFPPVEGYGRPAFTSVLLRIEELWKTRREALVEQGAQLAGHLEKQSGIAAPGSVGDEAVEAAVTQLSREFDPAHGGFGHAPKFPPATALSLLLRHHRRTGDELSLKIVRVTLDAMARGGLYDQIGGGFARYSTDERWLVPHFEKMLYDNALLARIYLEAHQVTADPFYRRIASEVLDYVLKEMTAPEGGFYSATDADSEGVEGKFFVWTPAEVRAVLPEEDALWACAYYDITEPGNWEGKNIPNTPRPMEALAERFGAKHDAFAESIRRSRKILYEERARRVPPGLDDKILTAWNGLMIGAMAEGARVLDEARYLAAAARAADFILSRMRDPGGRLLRTHRAGRSRGNAYLEDYAYLCEALIDLHEAGGAARFLGEAERLAERLLTDFSPSDGGGFYHTSRDHEKLLLRQREGYDGAIPNANASAAFALARLSFFLDRADFRKAAGDAVQGYGAVIRRFPRAFVKSLIAADFLLEGPVEIALIGREDDPRRAALAREINRRFIPNRIIAHRDPDARAEAEDPRLPLLEGKTLVDGGPALYLCRNFTCGKPVTDPSGAGAALETLQTSMFTERKATLSNQQEET